MPLSDVKKDWQIQNFDSFLTSFNNVRFLAKEQIF